MEKWKCTICNHIHEGPMNPDFECPVCHHGADKFIKMDPTEAIPVKNR